MIQDGGDVMPTEQSDPILDKVWADAVRAGIVQDGITTEHNRFPVWDDGLDNLGDVDEASGGPYVDRAVEFGKPTTWTQGKLWHDDDNEQD